MPFFKKRLSYLIAQIIFTKSKYEKKDDIFTRKFFDKSFFKIGISNIEHAKCPVTIYNPKKKILLLSATKKTQQV